MLIFSGCVIMVLGQHCWLNGIITSWESIQSHYTCKNYPDLSISRPVYLRISVRFLHMLIYRTTDRKIWVNVTLTVTVAFKCEKRRQVYHPLRDVLTDKPTKMWFALTRLKTETQRQGVHCAEGTQCAEGPSSIYLDVGIMVFGSLMVFFFFFTSE